MAPTLSACLIVRDEERFLGRCLESLRGVADEICVLDTGSRDRTVAIALEHGAKVAERPWDDDFSAARNACLAIARGDWILQIDADEELAPPRPGEMQRILSEPSSCRLVEIDLLGDGGRIERTRQPRLFRRASGLRYRRALHETILDDLAERGLPAPAPCGLLLVHHGYLGDVVASRGKIERNRRILRGTRDRGEADAYDLFKLASALDHGSEPSLEVEAAATWRECMERGWSSPLRMREEWPWWTTACRAAAARLWFLGDPFTGSAILARLHGERPGDDEVRRALAGSELRRGLAREALARLRDDASDRRLRILSLEAAGDLRSALALLDGDRSPGADALRGRILSGSRTSTEAAAFVERAFSAALEDPETGLDAATALSRLGETDTARALLSRPLPCAIELGLEREAAREAADGLARPPRTFEDAARLLVDGVLGGEQPRPVPPGFHASAVLDHVGSILERLLERGCEERVLRFAASSRDWEPAVPGISRLVEGA